MKTNSKDRKIIVFSRGKSAVRLLTAAVLLFAACSGDGFLGSAGSLKNNLNRSSSAYLLSAAHQPVFWQEWGEEAFELAKKLDRPILLDIGAVWNHWCHVMSRESYENQSIADLINENFIAIKVDRDERPDVDKRFQAYVQSISGQGGWPLTCFLTPDGRVFYGGTYFPPEDVRGVIGLKRILIRIKEVYQTEPETVIESADNIFAELNKDESSGTGSINPDNDLIQSIVDNMKSNFDAVNGGFGGSPKFPYSSAIDFALAEYDRTKDKDLLNIAQKTLEKMAKGGIHDQLGGGFHRYSVDDSWEVPHFEKLTMENAELLSSYVNGYQLTKDERFKRVADGIIRFFDSRMTDRENGGFYAHQDADVSHYDDGDYYTWTKREIDEYLDPQQAEVFSLYYGVTANPRDIFEVPDRNVLFEVYDLNTIAQQMNITAEKAEEILISARSVIREERAKRKTPFIDKTIFASHNGSMISAYADAYKVFGDENLKTFALKTLDFVVDNLYSRDQGFAHTYIGGEARIYWLLEDQVRMAKALLDGFEISGNIRYLDLAQEVMDSTLERFGDSKSGGFFDRVGDKSDIEVLAVTKKPIEDVSITSPNALAIRVLDRLYALTDRQTYKEASEKALKTFAAAAQSKGLYASGFALALRYHLDIPAQVIVIGKSGSDAAENLVKTARSVYRPGTEVYLFDPEIIPEDRVPEVVRSKMAALDGSYSDRQALAFVCIGKACAPPTADPEQLARLIQTFGR